MAELAHDASRPASSKAAGIALQNGPTSSDEGKLRVFISYSRDDNKFADQLDAALNAWGFECLIDRHGVSGGEDWKRRLGNLISEADTVVFVLTPKSARSEICAWEVEEAERLNKRILPILPQPLEVAEPPPRLRDRNYIFFYEEPKLPGSGFGTGLVNLVTALNTDFDWLREHTRYLQRAREWDERGRPANRLLSGDDIAEAKAWAARRPKNAPEPTALHLDFIRASEEEAVARLSEQRKHLEAVAAAQAERETALQEREEAQRKRAAMARIRNIALVAVSILAVLAGWLYWREDKLRQVAEEQKAAAEAQRAAAQEQKEYASQILADSSRIFADEVLDKMDIGTKQRVVAVFQRGAERGDAASMNALGVFYRSGMGVAQDYTKAREWWEKAADKGEVYAMTNLGWLFAEGHGVPQDYAKAREWYEKAVAKDDADAMTNLGWLFAEGHGVPKDYTKAREWYEKAAAKDDATAMGNLGSLFEKGLGVPKDYTKAREWYEKAAAKDDASAMTKLGALYAEGRGMTPDYAKAREWWEKAAAKDDARAMIVLGLLYSDSLGVAQDYTKAREWWEKAAAKDEAFAMAMLGALYADGRGVPQDYGKAREWWEKAADKGEVYAMSSLGVLYRDGRGATQDYAKAREWLEKAAEKGEATAMAMLGALYADGRGVPQDYTKAREWLEKAAAKDNADAKLALVRLPIRVAANAERYAEALQLQEALAAKVEAEETKRDGKPGKHTAVELNNAAWFTLFAKDFSKALTVADRAHALFPDNFAIESNRAHALMFLGHGEECKTLYLAYKGKPISKDENKLWERAIAKDFEELRKAGLTHPMMADIEKELGVSSDGNSDISQR